MASGLGAPSFKAKDVIIMMQQFIPLSAVYNCPVIITLYRVQIILPLESHELLEKV